MTTLDVLIRIIFGERIGTGWWRCPHSLTRFLFYEAIQTQT